jgi:phage-related protein
MAMDMTTALTIKANVVGQSQITGLQNGLGKVTTQTNKAAGAMGRFKAAAGGALGAMRGLLPVIGVGAIGAFAKKSLDAADSMSKLSQRTGVAAPMLDKFRQAAELSDTSIQSLEKAFPNLARGIDDAVVKGTGPAAEAFSRLGVSLTDANGKVRETDQVMLDLADKFQQMPDGTEKAALASQIFGQRLGSELIPMLNMGGDAVRGMSTALTQEFADKSAQFNDKLTTMGEKLGQLGMKITEALLPFLEKLVDGVAFLAQRFAALPGPVQGVIAAIAGIAGVGLVFAPIIAAVTTLGPLMVGLAPIILKVVAVAAGLAAVGAAFNAIKDVVVEVARAINDVFIKPIAEGIQVLGKQIGEAFQATFKSVSEIFRRAFEFIGANFVRPIHDTFFSLVNSIGQAFRGVYDAITAPIRAAAQVVQNIVSGIMNAVQRAINAIRNLARRRSNSNTENAAEGAYWPGGFQAFAKGGVVNGPTLGLIGEGGESEYIVPASKAYGFAQNIMNGVRGPGAIPRFAEGGFVSPSANVNIQTGPVTQMGGQDFVTKADMSRAVQSGVQQTLDMIRRDGTVRSRLGLA